MNLLLTTDRYKKKNDPTHQKIDIKVKKRNYVKRKKKILEHHIYKINRIFSIQTQKMAQENRKSSHAYG